MSILYESFVINLDRQPERFTQFRQWNGGCGLTIQRFAAVDGVTVNEATRRAVVTDEAYSANPNKGGIGCRLSHKRLWEYAARIVKPIAVFEDDAVLRLDIKTVLFPLIAGLRQLWDIILLGCNTDAVLNFHPSEKLQSTPLFSPYPTGAELAAFQASTGQVRLLRLSNSYGLCGYVISPLGAKRLLQLCFPIENRLLFIPGLGLRSYVGLDHTLNAHYSSISAYMCWPPLVLSPNDPTRSETLRSGQ